MARDRERQNIRKTEYKKTERQKDIEAKRQNNRDT